MDDQNPRSYPVHDETGRIFNSIIVKKVVPDKGRFQFWTNPATLTEMSSIIRNKSAIDPELSPRYSIVSPELVLAEVSVGDNIECVADSWRNLGKHQKCDQHPQPSPTPSKSFAKRPVMLATL